MADIRFYPLNFLLIICNQSKVYQRQGEKMLHDYENELQNSHIRKAIFK